MSSQSCDLDTNNVVLQLEDPFGYDRADIKVDAIVEDLRVRAILPSPNTPAYALAIAQDELPELDAGLTYQPTGGDECLDRRVEKRVRHVRGIDIPNATTMELADRLPQSKGGFDRFHSLPSRTKAFRPTADITRLLAYMALRLQGFPNILSLAACLPSADTYSDCGH